MVPQCFSAREREIKTALVKEISAWLAENGYRTLEKDIRLFGMIGYRPEFHLRYRVFLNNIVGYTPPGGMSHSFIVALNGLSL